jgi:Putative prokaryotic signal transducing protein
MDEVPEIRLCEVANEVEAAMVVNLLNEDGVPARSDANQAMNVFGGLPFEPGHTIYVASSQARKAREILGNYPHFKKLKNVHEPE